MRSDRADGDPVEHFLEDGVAPPVIGGGPPESPFEVDQEPGSRDRHAQGGQEQRSPRPDYQTHRQEPPTSPIPVVRQLPPEQEPARRKSWVARMFRLPDR